MMMIASWVATVAGLLARGTVVPLGDRDGYRCVPPSKCWGAVPWHTLNRSVHGRLAKSEDELQDCLKGELVAVVWCLWVSVVGPCAMPAGAMDIGIAVLRSACCACG